MPLINVDTLKSFLGKDFIEQEPEGLDTAIVQAENLILQKTGVPIPESVSDAIPLLQLYAHSIVCWIISGMSDKLPSEEITRRRNMYLDAITALDDINKGKTIVYDKSGLPLTVRSSSDFYCNSDNRSERF